LTSLAAGPRQNEHASRRGVRVRTRIAVRVRLPPLTPAMLVRRYKRFLADVRLPDGSVAVAHLANPGRMTSCLRDDETPVLLSVGRAKLAWAVELAMPAGAHWVLVTPGRANAVVGEALVAGRIPALAGYGDIRGEQRYGAKSRVDWLLAEGARRAFVEVKNVTLVRGRVAAFPDAVTARGTRHLAELQARVAAGDRGVLVFHVGRADADVVTTADDIDPVYGAALRRAVAAGVELLAFRAEITPEGVTLGAPLPIHLPGGP
jgi:sugar fermentation stimulation protein A